MARKPLDILIANLIADGVEANLLMAQIDITNKQPENCYRVLENFAIRNVLVMFIFFIFLKRERKEYLI
jgi:hypothetical protein